MKYFTYSSLRLWIHQVFNSPFAFQVSSLGFLLVFLLSFRPIIVIDSPFFMGDFGSEKVVTSLQVKEAGFLLNQSHTSSAGRQRILVLDEAGRETVSYVSEKRTESLNYKVKQGDTISSIAHQFGVSVSTILWANDLTAKSNIKPEQLIKIPPVDGVFYTVQSGDTLSQIAKRHNVDINKMYTYNQLQSSSVVKADQKIFIPDAKKLFIPPAPVLAKKTTTTTSSGSSVSVTPPAASNESIGYNLARPTKGVLTQSFNRNHYALDIGNKLNTPIYASAAGTVTKSADGWNYGYGKYVVIDHGNDVETLYGHMNDRKVRVGDQVKTGELIGLMGNTGNVFGPTGIHLHFEVRVRGRKVNPLNYF